MYEATRSTGSNKERVTLISVEAVGDKEFQYPIKFLTPTRVVNDVMLDTTNRSI